MKISLPNRVVKYLEPLSWGTRALPPIPGQQFPSISSVRASALLIFLLLSINLPAAITQRAPLSPAALAVDADSHRLYIGCGTAPLVLVLDLESMKVSREIAVPAPALGLALSPDHSTLFATCAAPESSIAIIDLEHNELTQTIPAGHTAMAPILSPDGRTLIVCNRFNNEAAWIDLSSGRTIQRAPVPREPVASSLTPDGKWLFVANHLHSGRADIDVVRASVTVINAATATVVKQMDLPNGSGLLRGIAISPDGKYAAVTHLLSRFHLPTTQIERGWINNNALTLIDIPSLSVLNTVLLDNIDRGAANPWAVAWTPNGQQLIVTHAGTHDISIINAGALLDKLRKIPDTLQPGATIDYTIATHVAADVPNDLSFLVGLRARVKLPAGDLGPRAIALVPGQIFVANYFSDSISVMSLDGKDQTVRSVPLHAPVAPTPAQQGESYFNDAGICFQGWQSCASCHSSDARVDGLNWDNLNDGIGNPKNVKSLLFAHFTPPSMWLGVRANASIAVRAGIKNSLFTVQPPEVADAIDAYLKSLQPIPSPKLVHGKLSPAAERGKDLFFSEKTGCADCHRNTYYTDQKLHDVGTVGPYDHPDDKFDTPSLIEAWRSAPYLHDGSAATVADVLTTRNLRGRHGNTHALSQSEIQDLVEFVLSL